MGSGTSLQRVVMSQALLSQVQKAQNLLLQQRPTLKVCLGGGSWIINW